MTNASADTNAHGPRTPAGVAETGGARRPEGAHSADDFLSSIRILKDTEKSTAMVLEDAKRQSAKIESQARERAVEIGAKAAEKAVQAKNELISEGRKKTDGEIKEIIADAKKQAEKIRTKRLPDRDIQAIAEQVL